MFVFGKLYILPINISPFVNKQYLNHGITVHIAKSTQYVNAVAEKSK